VRAGKFILALFLLFCGISALQAQVPLLADAGNSSTICPGTTRSVGGAPTASGGTAPYTYSWSPAAGLSNTNTSNPIANPTVPTSYVVVVTDAAGNTDSDTVFVDIDPIYLYNAGNDTAICFGTSGPIGGINNSLNGGVTYSWIPTTGLNDPTAPRPITSTTVTITYSVTISSPNCPSKSYDVKVTVNPLPAVDACCYTTITEGQSTILSATGGVAYIWGGGNGSDISNPGGNPVTVEPVITTTYIVTGIDANGCQDWDTVTVVVKADTNLVFYNTFSPNSDGINDHFYIGNIYRFPQARLEVYTRTGQLVYAKTGYDNSWDGTNYGDRLPEATYYYMLDPGDGSPVFYKSVTIIR
jgi:gliding motility-associated-like protein